MKKIIDSKGLKEFSNSVKVHIKNMDKIMTIKESEERGKMIAEEMNRFDLSYQIFERFTLNQIK